MLNFKLLSVDGGWLNQVIVSMGWVGLGLVRFGWVDSVGLGPEIWKF